MFIAVAMAVDSDGQPYVLGIYARETWQEAHDAAQELGPVTLEIHEIS